MRKKQNQGAFKKYQPAEDFHALGRPSLPSSSNKTIKRFPEVRQLFAPD
jgi:hypothetical protein